MEEEVALVDPTDWAVVNRAEDVIDALPPPLAAHVSPETHACVLELKTGPHATAGGAARELAGLRRRLAEHLEAIGLRAVAAGTHPLARAEDVAVSAVPRYREVEATMRALVRREPTMALHVHVAVPDGQSAVRAVDGLHEDLPALLALAANSPFAAGRDTGFASIRVPIFGMFPRSGATRRFGRYEAYVEAVDALLRARAIPEPGFVWWDVRVQPRIGTVEVRILDAQSRVRDVAALTAVVQCLVLLRAAAPPGPWAPPELLAENRFLAARDGMGAELLDARAPRGRRRAAEALAALLGECAQVAGELGCEREIEGAARLAVDPGHVRQRELAAEEGLAGVVRVLSEDFAGATRGADAMPPASHRPTGTSARR